MRTTFKCSKNLSDSLNVHSHRLYVACLRKLLIRLNKWQPLLKSLTLLDLFPMNLPLKGFQWTIKVSTGDNVFILVDICLIVNIVDCYDGIYVVYQTFLDNSIFFTYPFNSDFLNIHIASQVSKSASMPRPVQFWKNVFYYHIEEVLCLYRSCIA